tara:strand:+ start:233 stop:1174 length:942 start_codon:yes stop_codon:yes gene_type:complete
MRRGKLKKSSLILIILTAIFTLISYASDQMVIRSEDELRNTKIFLENTKNKVTEYELLSDSLYAIAMNADLELQSRLFKRNFLIKSIILLDDDIEIISKKEKNIFSEKIYGNNAKSEFKWQLMRELSELVFYMNSIAIDYANIHVYQEELINKINQNKIKKLENLFFNNENLNLVTLNLKDKFFYKDISIYNDLLRLGSLSQDETDEYRLWALEKFDVKNFFDIYKYKMFILNRLDIDASKIDDFIEILDEKALLIEEEIENTFISIQKININKNYFILLSILFQVLSLLFLLLLFKSFLITPKKTYKKILTV